MFMLLNITMASAFEMTPDRSESTLCMYSCVSVFMYVITASEFVIKHERSGVHALYMCMYVHLYVCM
jgi:hypothetical protein